MGILLDKVRITNFRAIKNLEVSLSKLIMLVGANNSGKTSFLKALNLALGIDRKIVNREDDLKESEKIKSVVGSSVEYWYENYYLVTESYEVKDRDGELGKKRKAYLQFKKIKLESL